MKHKALIVAMCIGAFPLHAAMDQEQLQQQVHRLEEQSRDMQAELNRLKQQIGKQNLVKKDIQTKKKADASLAPPSNTNPGSTTRQGFHTAGVTVHALDAHPESLEFYPTALIADEQVVTYIAGTPVVTSPYLGARPAFDGSDYIVNISSINRDIRLMQQRRRLYRAYQQIGYPVPNMPILALSGKVEPVGLFNRPYFGNTIGNLTLGSSELDTAAALNDLVEGYMSIAYDESAPMTNGQRVANSSFFLNMGFVNVGNLDKSPLYFTAGQLYVPFGRYSSSMISGTLPMQMARTRTRPFIFGYKSQEDTGPFASAAVRHGRLKAEARSPR
ncbi:coiled-coil protein [Legionella londiniensis]|nr:LbtU family siderophore porin [Legionella londiniensis]STX92183.1 coiled-coil protein [Legionella londiniensis]